MTIAHDVTPTQLRWNEERKARMQRVANAARLAIDPKPAGRVVMLLPVFEDDRQEWMKSETAFDQHVIDSEKFLSKACNWPAYIECKANEYGFSRAELISDAKSRDVLFAREEGVYSLYQTGRLSTRKIGRLLRRDHTSVMYQLWKAKARRGDEEAIARISRKRVV